MRGGTKSRVLTSSLSPQGGAYSGVLKSKKSLSLPDHIGVGLGTVVSNDWCIIIAKTGKDFFALHENFSFHSLVGSLCSLLCIVVECIVVEHS